MSAKKPKILFVGFAVADIIDGDLYLGGAAGSMSINATHLGVKASLLAPLSSDQHGELYKNALDKAQVDHHVCGDDAPHLPTCTINDQLGLGSTRNWQDNGALDYFLHMPVPQNLDQKYDAIFLCNAWRDVGEKVAASISTRCLFYIPGPKAVENRHWISPQILDKTMVVFCNAEESVAVWESQPFDHGVEIIVATAGSQGGKVYLQNGQVIPYQATKVQKVIDPTGAGDAWSLGFAREWYASRDIIASINLGNQLSSACIQRKGAIISHDRT